MIRAARTLIYALLGLALLSAPLRADDITVFAAASLRGALDDIAALSPDTVTLSYAGSGLIARQIAQGAPADVVVLAHPIWMEWLDTNVRPDTITPVAHNRLVVIAKAPEPDIPITDQLKTYRIAMGHRQTVPAGIYAKAWLEHIDLWDAITPNLIETDNVRLALALVARGDVPLGITYHSDALSDPRVQIIYNVPPDTHPNIIYPAAAVTERGRAFINLLTSPQAQDIFRAHGFGA